MVLALLKILQRWRFGAFSGKQASTAILTSRKSVSSRSPQPPALRVEVTALAQRKRQGFLLLFLLLPYFAVFGRGRASGGVFTLCHKWPTTAAWCAEVVGCCPSWWAGHKSAHRGLHGGLGGEVGFGHIQLQLPELALLENIHCRIDGENRVEIVAFPLHSGLIIVAAGRYGDETCLQKSTDAFQSSIFGQTSFSGNGIVAGMAGVCFAVLDQQQISVDHERRRRQIQQEDFVRECEKFLQLLHCKLEASDHSQMIRRLLMKNSMYFFTVFVVE